MGFYQKYELLELLHDDGIKSFKARVAATGQEVLAHLFVGVNRAEDREVLDGIAQLAPESRRAILEVGDHEGTPYVVTQAAPGLATLRNWVRSRPGMATVTELDPFSRAGKWRVPDLAAKPSAHPAAPVEPPVRSRPEPPPPAPPAPPPPPPPLPKIEPPPAREPGEFTKLFQAPPVHEPAPPALPSHEPGAFTRLFQSPAASGPSEPELPAQPAASEPGEFTKLFRSPLGSSMPEAPEALEAPGATAPGEFTKLFQAPLGGGGAERTPDPQFNDLFSAPRKPSPGGQHPQDPGEFTRMFGPSGLPGAPPPVQPISSGRGSATNIFAVPPAVRPPAAEPPAKRPGQYTKQFASPVGIPPASVPAPPPPPAAQAPRPSRSYLPLLLGLNALLLVVLILVVYLLLRHH